MDKLDINQNIQEGGDGFFDAIDGVTVLKDKGLLIFPTIEPFGNFIFEKLSSSSSEQYDQPNTYNVNQKNMFIKSSIQKEKHLQKNLFKKINSI